MTAEEKADEGGNMSVMFWFFMLTFSSTSLILLNKGIMHEFHHPNTLLMVQNGLTVVFNLLGTKLGYFEMKAWKMAHFKLFVVPTILFTVMLFCSLKALPFIAVATTIIFRNIGTVLVAIAEFLVLHTVLNQQKVVAIGIIIVGSVIYAGNDINYDPTGYMWITANTILYAVNMVYEKFAVMEVDQTPAGISCYQNLLSIPVCLALMAMTSEFEDLAEHAMELSPTYKGYILFSGALGCSLSICYMTLYKLTSATSISIAGNINKLLSAIVGAIVFHNALTEHVIAGLLVCLGGGMLYSAKTDVLAFLKNCAAATKEGIGEEKEEAERKSLMEKEAKQLAQEMEAKANAVAQK